MRNAKRAAFNRKIFYLLLLAVLLFPLYLISRPSFRLPNGERSQGGLLTQMREEYGLSQSNLGDIDPASESMKLATLGMRGVAANLLWSQANEAKKKEQWDKLSATLNQIAKLQPNFISVWQFQSWNLSYNVSVEFDNYKHRYHWVKKGIDFLLRGIEYNRDEPRLLWDLGWFFGHKFGRSDEYKQFRREYSNDRDFHETLPLDTDAASGPNGPDNWLAAHEWFTEAQRVVDQQGVPIRGKNPLVFHSDPPKALIRFAMAIEDEGYLDEFALAQWQKAHDAWLKYGDRDIPTSYGYKIRLNEGERWLDRVEERNNSLDELLPGVREELEQQRRAQLTDEEKRVLNMVLRELQPEEYRLRSEVEEAVNVTAQDLVEAAPSDKKREARRLANRINEANAYSTTIRRYRDIVNFIYWRTRCEVEKTELALEARKYLDEAGKAYRNIDLDAAKQNYELAWDRWAKIHEKYPILAEDVTAEDLVDPMKQYRTLLGRLDEEFPPPGFQMMQLVANYADEFGYSVEEANALLAKFEESDGEDPADQDATSSESTLDTTDEDPASVLILDESDGDAAGDAETEDTVETEEAAQIEDEAVNEDAAENEESPNTDEAASESSKPDGDTPQSESDDTIESDDALETDETVENEGTETSDSSSTTP